MRRLGWAWWLVSILACASGAHADDPIGRIGLGISGGYSTYALGSVNDRIDQEGNDWLTEKGWDTLDPLKKGWSFWADAKVPLPLGLIGLTEFRGVPLDFYVTAGYGVSSGKTGGLDYNELIEIEGAQTAVHARLLYVIPWRFHEDVRIFAGGGPLFISEQKVTATHTSRRTAGGSGAREVERTEEITYKGDGLGSQLGIVLEYLLQERLTLAFDLAYRWAGVDYSTWSSAEDVLIEDTDEVVFDDDTTSLERLDRTDGYVLHGFLDAAETERLEQQLHGFGPYREQLVPWSKEKLDIDLSGIQVHLGFRIHIF